MAIIVLKAWYLDSVLSVAQVGQMVPDLRLSRTGLLKTGMRADFLDDVDQVKNSLWFQRYLEGELIEFYIEGSGAYSISNLDLISREMYFNKRNTLSQREPIIFFSGQTHYLVSTQAMTKVLQQLVDALNRKQNPVVPLQLEQSLEGGAGRTPIDAALIRKIKHALFVVADVTPIATLQETLPFSLPSPQVCVEVGYALQCKRPEDILLIQMYREGYDGPFPFEIAEGSYLLVKDTKQLQNQITQHITRQLQKAKVIS
ncbi:MAG: hypothetical protein HC921_09315 [Synechococcaceae cyanobacterium SM2_3_1]|nr:hypothetical protein [Synechococcaceae cyanobacterium SM2_3_1]